MNRMLAMGTRVRSDYDPKLKGTIVGYGIIQWPDTDPDLSGDPSPTAVYLIQISRGSSALGPACRVLHVDHTIEEEEEEEET